MKNLYCRLACDGIRKNRRIYMPYLLSYTGMVMMFYIFAYLASSNTLYYISCSGQLNSLMFFGMWIVALFAALFLFYTNSFLIRKRKKEFGLYNVLGMGKRHLSLIIFFETLIVAFLTLVAGLFLGIVFSKLAEMIMISLVKGSVPYTLSVSLNSILTTIVVFGIIFVLILLNSLRQVKFSTALSLLKSESVGEKNPKGNWVPGILGLIFLAAGYWLAVTVAGPHDALEYFFIAVILVIIGTYLLMISGSVLLCRVLKKNKKYYYRPNHFVPVSSMMFRMKRNGAGLASICILSTMVLVTMSTFTCLYVGFGGTLKTEYPREANCTFFMDSQHSLGNDNLSSIKKDVDSYVKENGAEAQNAFYYALGQGYGMVINGTEAFFPDADYQYDNNKDSVYLYIVDVDDYNRINGTNVLLADDEVLLYAGNFEYNEDVLNIRNGQNFRIKEKISTVPVSGTSDISHENKGLWLVVSDITSNLSELSKLYEQGALTYYWKYFFDTGLPKEDQSDFLERMINSLDAGSFQKDHEIYYDFCYSTAELESEFEEMYASLFFLGILLSMVFLFAAVLIIYYKQLSEGYEDRKNFEIMQKIGMTKKEIKKSINSQLLVIFGLPIFGALCHMAFAFPMISKMIRLFNIYNNLLFAKTAAICFIIFAIFYGIVYKATSGAYYKIVKNESICE